MKLKSGLKVNFGREWTGPGMILLILNRDGKWVVGTGTVPGTKNGPGPISNREHAR